MERIGGGMRKAGVVAAAGQYALENNVARLAEDHAHAAALAAAMHELPKFSLAEAPQTNMVMLDVAMELAPLIEHLAGYGININGHRWVFHLDISSDDCDKLIAACRSY